MNTSHGPVVIRRRLGFVLKQLRGRRGLHLDAVARQLEISPSKLSRLETGQVEPKVRDVRDLLDIYDVSSETREQIMQWTLHSKQPGWWQPFSIDVIGDLDFYISLETESHSAKVYSTPINGLLQTAEYARELLAGAVPHASTAELDVLVDVRLRRQLVLSQDRTEAPPLELHSILDESALRRGFRGSGVLSDQLRELLERSEQPNVTLQIFPFSAGYAKASSTFSIFEPRREDDRAVVNVESSGVDAYYDAPNDVHRFRSIWDDLAGRSLGVDESRAFIRELLGTHAPHGQEDR